MTSAKWSVDWAVPLRVRSGTTRDSQCFIGAASRAFLAPKPPPAHDGPMLTLSAPNRTDSGAHAVALAQTGLSNVIWTLKIENLKPGQPVELTASDLSALPANAVALLEDPVTGQTVYLRGRNTYSFTPRAGETARSLRLTVSPRTAALLSVQGLNVQALKGRGAQAMFSLSAAAETTVTVMNIAGRTVRVLEEGKTRPAGNNVVLWDGQNRFGSPAPAGMYLLEVVARTPTGETARALSQLRLQGK